MLKHLDDWTLFREFHCLLSHYIEFSTSPYGQYLLPATIQSETSDGQRRAELAFVIGRG